jgi:hypothetical protein
VLAHSGVPIHFWCYCAVYVNFVLNHLPHCGIKYLSALGAAGHEWCTATGLSDLKMGYDVLDIETCIVIQTRNIRTDEISFPFKNKLLPCKIVLGVGNYPEAMAPVERFRSPIRLFHKTKGGKYDIVPLVEETNVEADLEREVLVYSEKLHAPTAVPAGTSAPLLSPIPIIQSPSFTDSSPERSPLPTVETSPFPDAQNFSTVIDIDK